ncbi:5-formyltetrahydrofolate cyclo-ligase-like [Anthonomus grandis grandis]|uniref:5-formyltetrahydrofolate cyclo-ligase-like n=1 Tax=Anthonomus grandis grandis TaxID=2921223 RepID=UPI002165B16C|nr:5-formyltetrahydrofolate cyclo-ligase-like [Anthonomus grandis grandis]
MANIVEAKKAIRALIPDKIAQLSCEEKARQSKIVFNKLINLPVFNTSKRISVYLSTADEIDTEPIVRTIFAQGKECFVPRYCKAGMQMVKLRSMEDWETLPLTKWNIKQPLLKDVREDAIETGGLDLIICPGVAFTKKGDRLGHGGGYYDVFQKKLRETQKQSLTSVAVAFKEQILDELPLTDRDVTVDMVLYSE